MSGLGHAARLLGLLRLAADELDEAATAFLTNVAEFERLEAAGTPSREVWEEDMRLAVVVHLRVETLAVLARLAFERLGVELPPALAPDRDLHVTLEDGDRAMTASVWAASGDAGISPGRRPDAVDLRGLLAALERYFAAARTSPTGQDTPVPPSPQ